MAKAKKLPSGQWRVLVYGGKNPDGSRHYESFTADSKSEAEYLGSQYKVQRKKVDKVENILFKDAVDKYISSKSNILSPSTIRGYRIMQRNAFPTLTNCTLENISSSNAIQEQMNMNSQKYSSKSIKNQYGFISAVMKYYKLHIDDVRIKTAKNRKVLVPSESDVHKIMHLLNDYPKIECQILLALTCSLRQSEIAAIRVEDVNNNTIYIHAAKVPDEFGKLVYKSTNKSEAGTRTILMPPYLERKIKTRCECIKDGFIFHFTPSWVLKLFKRMLIENGMPPYTVHSLRHAFAAIMHARGIPDKYVMEMGGWKTDSVLKRIYQYTFEEKVNSEKQKANQYFESLMQHEMQHDD